VSFVDVLDEYIGTTRSQAGKEDDSLDGPKMEKWRAGLDRLTGGGGDRARIIRSEGEERREIEGSISRVLQREKMKE